MGRLPTTLRTYTYTDRLLAETAALLRDAGRQGFESAVLWVGTVVDDTTASLLHVIRPRQRALSSADGVCVEITQDGLMEVIAALPDDVFVLARVHTHPGVAYHSHVDDQNMVISHEGAISIVVPNFAREPIVLVGCSVNELRHDLGWVELSAAEVTERFVTR